jgi:acetyltransferase-like isoleucine patch superfamily enzyme
MILLFYCMKQMKKIIQNIFGLRKDVGINFYIADFFFRKILRQNAATSWAVHYTSTLHFPQNISRGINVYPGDSPGNYIEASNGVFIGDYTNIGPNVGIVSANHNLTDNSKHDKAPPIKIGKFCWIGMNAVVLPGVELGDFTIVGAGTVVSKSFTEGYCVLGGTPAQIIRHLDKEECLQFSSNKKHNY